MWTQGHDAPHGIKLMFFYTNHTFKIHEHDLYSEHSIIVCNVVILHITATFTSVSEYEQQQLMVFQSCQHLTVLIIKLYLWIFN